MNIKTKKICSVTVIYSLNCRSSTNLPPNVRIVIIIVEQATQPPIPNKTSTKSAFTKNYTGWLCIMLTI